MNYSGGNIEKYANNSTSHLEYLWYKEIENKCYFPKRYYEMYLIDYFEDRNIKVNEIALNLSQLKNNKDWIAHESYLSDYIKEDENGKQEFVFMCCDLKDHHVVDESGKKMFHVDHLYNVQVYTFNCDVWLFYVKDLDIMFSNYFLIKLTKDDLKCIKKY